MKEEEDRKYLVDASRKRVEDKVKKGKKGEWEGVVKRKC